MAKQNRFKEAHVRYLRFLVRWKQRITKPGNRKVVNFLTSAFTYIVMAIIAIPIGILLWCQATRQYYPEVKKVVLKQNHGPKYSIVRIECTLFSNAMNDGNKSDLSENEAFMAELVPDDNSLLTEKGDSTFVYDRNSSVYFAGPKGQCYDKDYEPDEPWIETSVIPGDKSSKTRLTKINESEYQIESVSTGTGLPAIKPMLIGEEIYNPSKKGNPYIAFHLNLKDIEFSDLDDSDHGGSWLTMCYNADFNQETDNTKAYEHPLNIISVFPQPTSITPTEIAFMGKDLERALGGGVYFIAEDISKKRVADRVSFICSIFLGAFLSMFLQLIAAIITRWKKAFPPKR